MINPDFDPLSDLHQCMQIIDIQHKQIDLLMKISNQQQNAIYNINSALTILGDRIKMFEKVLNEIK